MPFLGRPLIQRVVDRLAQGAQYAAKVVGPGRWTAEMKIPFRALGIDPHESNPRLLFNLSARKPASDLWAMWMQAPGAHTHDVRKGGLLWLDATRPKPFGLITHAHGDHVARHTKALCTPETAELVRAVVHGRRAKRGAAWRWVDRKC